jgi:transcriptional regulator with XRE-family HTH domain
MLHRLPMTFRVRLGRSIARRRREAGYSQEAFAAKCGLHRTFMGAVERGEKNVSLATLEKIARGLRLKLSELFRDAEA